MWAVVSLPGEDLCNKIQHPSCFCNSSRMFRAGSVPATGVCLCSRCPMPLHSIIGIQEIVAEQTLEAASPGKGTC